MSTKLKWVIALFVLQLVAWIGIGISSGMAAIGSIAAAFGMSAFGIAGFVVWHYESMDKLKKQYENKEKRAIGFVVEKESTSETPAPTPIAEQEVPPHRSSPAYIGIGFFGAGMIIGGALLEDLIGRIILMICGIALFVTAIVFSIRKANKNSKDD